jgi:hypothetical protein
MKRINPETGAPFHRGDVRADGFVFFAYTNVRRLNGHFKEIWLRPEVSDRVRVRDRESKRRVYREAKTLGGKL